MKQILKLTLLLLALLLPATAHAHDFEVDGIYYRIDGDNATVTDADGNWQTPDYSGDVTIPETVTYNGTTYSVTEIGYNAFEYCSGLTSITIPNSVTTIGYSAFRGCTGLTSVNIPNSVTEIGSSAFFSCSGLTSATIGNSVTTIGYQAFAYCSGLTSITIPNSVTSILEGTFANCSKLKSITIPSSVTSIECSAFHGCIALKTLNFNAVLCSNFTYSRPFPFENTGISTINIGDSVQRIPSYFAYGLESLSSIVIPNSVTEIGESAFDGCLGLATVTMGNTVKTIGNSAFYGCEELTSITIPRSITAIGDNAFEDCLQLDEVYSYKTNPSAINMGTDVFARSPSNYGQRTLYVPIGSRATYQSDTKWSQFFGQIVETESVVLATSIELNETSAELNTGETLQLTATVLPSNATNKTVTWSTSNSSVATVNSNGLVTAISLGTATITAMTTDGSNLSASCTIIVRDNSSSNLAIGEWATLSDGTPAMVGQTTNDHLFVRGDYNDNGMMETYDNVVSFKSGEIQTVWLWLDDDEFYLNDKVQALTPTLIDNNAEPYNEIAFNSFQCDIYLPEGIRMVAITNDNNVKVAYVQGDRMPNSAEFNWGEIDYVSSYRDNYFDVFRFTSEDGENFVDCCIYPLDDRLSSISNDAFTQNTRTKVIDGVTYNYYRIIVSNKHNNGTHLSSRDAYMYRTHGALKKDDAPVLGLFFQNDNQDVEQGRLADIILANQEFGFREAFTANPQWEPNDYRFIYGEGGNNETQRFQYYNRVALYGSKGIEMDEVLATDITINLSQLNLLPGNSSQLVASVLPESATNKVVAWASSNPSVATVNSNGLVTAISPGTATITAMTTDDSNLSASCEVIVNQQVIATAISLNKTNAELTEGNSMQLTATVLPSDATNKTVAWSTSNSSVATVNSNGLVTAISPGTATITAMTTDGSNLSASCMMTVNQQVILATAISLNKTSAELTEGNSMQLTATVLPSNATNKTVTWTSSKRSVANVNSNGLVTAISPGTATITATTTDGTNLSASCVVTVNQQVVLATSISLNQTNAELTEGNSMQLTATVLPSNATNKTVNWSTSNSSVATISSNGLVTAISPGTATITAMTTDGSNLSASCLVTVTEDLNDYENYLSIDNIEAFHGDTIVIPVKMFNEASIISFQTDIFLPEGLELLQEDGEYVIDPSERMTRTHTIMSNDISSGAIRVICYSSNYKSFTGNSGDDLFYLTVKVADDAEGDYTVQMRNTLLTTSDFEEIAAPDVAANVNVKAYLLGDANNSGTVTITDVVVTSQYVLEMNPQPFVFEAADANFDGNITVTDVSRIAWMVLNPDEANAPMRASVIMDCSDHMSGEGITLATGETRTVSIALNNTMDYTACQLDLRLPEGLTASNFRLTDRAGSHALDINTLANGKTRALCYSPAIEVIDGHDGALLTFDVTATAAIEGCITIDGIELVTADCQTVHPDAFTIGVNAATGINEIAGSKTVARVDYFNVAGQRIDRPDSGVILVVTTYTDGTRSTTKLIR